MRTRSSLVDDTAAELRRMIVGGQLRPGEYLPPQKELAARFGVGASTIREAVQTLIAVGLLQSHPGKGTWVREDAGAGLIHPEAVKSPPGRVERPVAGRGSLGGRGRAHRARRHPGDGRPTSPASAPP